MSPRRRGSYVTATDTKHGATHQAHHHFLIVFQFSSVSFQKDQRYKTVERRTESAPTHLPWLDILFRPRVSIEGCVGVGGRLKSPTTRRAGTGSEYCVSRANPNAPYSVCARQNPCPQTFSLQHPREGIHTLAHLARWLARWFGWLTILFFNTHVLLTAV